LVIELSGYQQVFECMEAIWQDAIQNSCFSDINILLSLKLTEKNTKCWT